MTAMVEPRATSAGQVVGLYVHEIKTPGLRYWNKRKLHLSRSLLKPLAANRLQVLYEFRWFEYWSFPGFV